MAQYGQIVSDCEPEIDELFDNFVTFFGNPKMYKIKDVEHFSMYMTKTECLLTNECRYLVAFIRMDAMPVNHMETLSDLKWVSFQTRTMADRHNIPAHGYKAIHGPLKHVITKIEEKNEMCVYSCEDFPITITLFNKKNGPAYQNKGTIGNALETFQTIVTFN
jgi:hypothetical protein